MSDTNDHSGQAIDPLDPSSPWFHTGLTGTGRHASHHRALARGVKVVRVEVPGPVAIVPPDFPTFDEYGIIDIGEVAPIPAGAAIIFAQVTFEHQSTDPEAELAQSRLNLSTFLDGDDPNTGSSNLDLVMQGVAETADWTAGVDVISDAQYGYGEQVLYMYGQPDDDSGEGDEVSGEGSEFHDISAFFVYIDP